MHSEEVPRFVAEVTMESANYCKLIGRLSVAPEERTLPSGDVIVAFRLNVPRRDEQRVDTIDCVVRTAALKRRMLRQQPGAELEVEGALHRRFWRAGPSVASRYEVDIERFRMCK